MLQATPVRRRIKGCAEAVVKTEQSAEETVGELPLKC
jgi:hypothetical protein